MNYNYCCIHKQRTHEKTFVFSHALLISFGGKICYNKSIAWQRKCDGDKRKCHARDEMPEDSDPFQDGTVLKEAFDRLNKYVVG